jgi:hypothetical protein
MKNISLQYPKLALFYSLSPLIAHYYDLLKTYWIVFRLSCLIGGAKLFRLILSGTQQSRIDEGIKSLTESRQKVRLAIVILKNTRRQFIAIQRANMETESMLRQNPSQKPPN